MQSRIEDDQIFVPANINPGRFPHFTVDTLDFQENTPDSSSKCKLMLDAGTYQAYQNNGKETVTDI